MDRGVADLPLVRWKNGRSTDGSEPNDGNAEKINEASGISDGDQEGVRFLYPWGRWMRRLKQGLLLYVDGGRGN